MRRRLAAPAALVLACLAAACAPKAEKTDAAAQTSAGQRPAPYTVTDRIAGPDGGYDYLSVDSTAGRLFVAREYGVMAVDLATRAVTPRLVEANDVSAVLPIPDSNLMLSTVYGENLAIVFDRTSGKLAGSIPTGMSPDTVAWAEGLVFVMNAKSADITVIDVVKRVAVATIPLGGKPEAAVGDGAGKLYVNLEETAEVAVIDIATRKVERRLPLPGCVEPTGIAFDPATRLLIAACHNGVAKLIDSATGSDRGALKIGQNADGAIFDPASRLGYVPAKDGTLTVFRLDQKGAATVVETVSTEPGARTAALDPATGRLYLAARQPATGKDGEETGVPGTFRVLVVGR